MKTRRLGIVVVAAAFLLMPAVVGAGQKPPIRPSNPQANIFLENSLVRISVEDTDGNFGIGTSSTNPRPCESLLYGFSCGGSSSTTNIKVRVDGQVWDLADQTGDCDGEATYVSSIVVGGSIESRWTIPSPALSVLVKHTPVLFDATTGAILTETFVTNNDPTGAPHDIGVLYEYDTEVADNDAVRDRGRRHLVPQRDLLPKRALHLLGGVRGPGPAPGRGPHRSRHGHRRCGGDPGPVRDRLTGAPWTTRAGTTSAAVTPTVTRR